ncbi:hypothetical protein EV645_0002 [Kribbella rubisoli]|uniref:SIR2-like domain-containing protein n=1 Tax=Kribbella rubisoli TaxID=3075929 RepID=A0A4Q7XKT6_9ACTN|nr:hypothetical protein EV645_0002 [Kribbella rubisoli]
MHALVSAVRAYDAVIVLGAGASAFGYPMTAQLPALLWHAISQVEGAADELAKRAGRTGTPKEILGSDSDALVLGWQLVRDLPDVRTQFQQGFTSLDADRDPSPAHFNLARLIQAGKVQYVVSYNWDSCLERGYEQQFGASLPAGVLAKPHGDVARPDDPWVLPDEDGLVPETILSRLAQLDDRPRTLLVLGYSGSDPYVVDNLLAPLQNKWPVFQVSPSATGEAAVPATADEVTTRLAAQLLPSIGTGLWRYVRFDRSRDFSAALRGERLRPVDVAACPELPYAPRLADRLRSAKLASVSGEPGSGKSITAFHAAHRLHKEGWTILELVRAGVAGMEEVAEFRRMPGRVLAVVDDVQAIASAVVAELESSVDDDHAVLLVSTQRLESHNDETVTATRAQQVIYEHCLRHLETVGPLLSLLDHRVGKSMTKEKPELRLEAANASSKEPWTFMFVASGGDRRMSGIMDRFVEQERPALMLGAISIGQMTSQDAGVGHDDVGHWLAQVAPEQFITEGETTDPDRFAEAIDVLLAERLVRRSGGRLRAAHIRIADRALKNLAQRNEAGIGAALLAIVRSRLLTGEVPILGKLWLVRTFESSDIYRYQLLDAWLDAEVLEAVVGQCLGATPGRERSAALHLLWTLNRIAHLDRSLLEDISAQVIAWLPDVLAIEASGFQWMLTGLRPENRDLHDQIRESVPAGELSRLLCIRGTRHSAPQWARLVAELAGPYDRADREAWSTNFTDGLDTDALHAWIADIGPDSHADDVYELIDTLAQISPQAAKVAIEAASASLRHDLERDLADATHGISAWAFRTMFMVAVLAESPGTVSRHDMDLDSDSVQGEEGVEASAIGQGDFGALEDSDDAQWVPDPALLDLAAATQGVFESVNWESAGASLQGRELHELDSLDLFLHWLGALSTDLLDRLADAVPVDWLDQLLSSPDQPGSQEASDDVDLERIARVLAPMAASTRGSSLVRTFIERHSESVRTFPFHLIEILPDVAVGMANAGRTVRLENPRGGGWESNTAALQALVDVDREAATAVLQASADNLRQAIAEPQRHDMNGLATFVAIADELDQSVLDSVYQSLAVAEVESIWRTRLSDAQGDATVLVKRAAGIDGSVGDLGRSLLNL